MNLVPLKVAIIDQQRVFIDALTFRLTNESDIEVVYSAEEAESSLAGLLKCNPGVVILDAEIPLGGSFNLAAELRLSRPDVRILFLTCRLNDSLIDQALRLKIDGILSRGEPVTHLVDSIRRTNSGECSFSEDVGTRLAYDPVKRRYRLRIDPPLKSLTNRQLEIFRHLARGASVKAVAQKLLLTPKSVENQKCRIMSKLGVKDKVSLALYAVREGLIEP